MSKETISATAARRQLSRLLERVRAGESFVVTVRGVPVAKLVPVELRHQENREDARRRLLERLQSQPVMNIGPWTRDELYDDE